MSARIGFTRYDAPMAFVYSKNKGFTIINAVDRATVDGMEQVLGGVGGVVKLVDVVKPGCLELKGGSVLMIPDMALKPLRQESSLCLDFCISNDNGTLTYNDLGWKLASMSRRVDVRARMVKHWLDSDAVLMGFVIGRDGKLHPASLPLGDHYENDDGYIKQKKDGHFQYTATSFSVDSGFVLSARLAYWSLGGGYRLPTYPIYRDIQVGDDGNIWIDGPFLEEIPVLGYVIAGVDAIAGDDDEAIHAAAVCTYPTIVLAATIAGATFGGPLGAAVGSAIAQLAAPYVEAEIAKGISDPTMRGELTAVSLYKILIAEVFVVAGVGIGEISSAFGKLLVEELTAEGFDTLFSSMAGSLGKKGLNSLTKKEMKLYVLTLKHTHSASLLRFLYVFLTVLTEKPLREIVDKAKLAVQPGAEKAVQETKQNVRSAILKSVVPQDRAQSLRTALQEVVQNSLGLIREAAAKKAEEDWRSSYLNVLGNLPRVEDLGNLPAAKELGKLPGAKDVSLPAAEELQKAIWNAMEKVRNATREAVQDTQEEVRLTAQKTVPEEVAAAIDNITQASYQAVDDAVYKMGEEVQEEVQAAVHKHGDAAQAFMQVEACEAQQKAQNTIQETIKETAVNAQLKIQQYAKSMEKTVKKIIAAVQAAAQEAVSGTEQEVKEEIRQTVQDPAQKVRATVQEMAQNILESLREAAREEGRKEWRAQSEKKEDWTVYLTEEDGIQKPPKTAEEALERFGSAVQKAVKGAEEEVMLEVRKPRKLWMVHCRAWDLQSRRLSRRQWRPYRRLRKIKVQEAGQAAHDKIQKAIQAVMLKAANDAVQEEQQKIKGFDMGQEVFIGEVKGKLGRGGWPGHHSPSDDLLKRLRKHQ
ncbi:hypothetical protein BBP40_004104 [Aspergillus hancockii]|nr:hypothetical protein BBP40_004104 [Aspergillus hancockii]